MKEFEVSLIIRNNLLKERRLALGMSQRQIAEAAGVHYHTYVAFEGMRESPLRTDYSEIRRRKACIACGAPALPKMTRFRYLCVMCFGSSPDVETHRQWLDAQPKRWKPSAQAVAGFLGVAPEECWPDSVLFVRKGRTTKKLSSGDLRVLMSERRDAAVALLEHGAQQPDELIATNQLAESIQNTLTTITKRERSMIERHYGLGRYDPHTLQQLSDRFGVSVERVRQVIGKGIRKLRHPSRANTLRAWR
jgi:RNA polymerase sigma factor (sigma-70 family)